jgi:cytochrome c-type biogenesis protein CcmH
VTIAPAARAALRFAAALLVLLAPLAASGQDTVLDPEVFEIGRELRCPTCVSESVAESNAAVAQEMRRIIQEQLDEGRSRGEIIASFQASYGDWILLEPPTRGVFLFVWLVPIAALAAAALGLVVLTRRWRAAADVPPAPAADLALVRAALAADRGAADPPPDATGDAGAPPTPAARR